MKNYTITVNGNVYDVTVEETGSTPSTASTPRRAAAPAAAAPKAAAPAGAVEDDEEDINDYSATVD